MEGATASIKGLDGEHSPCCLTHRLIWSLCPPPHGRADLDSLDRHLVEADGLQEIICRVENSLARRFTTFSTSARLFSRGGVANRSTPGYFETIRFTI